MRFCASDGSEDAKRAQPVPRLGEALQMGSPPSTRRSMHAARELPCCQKLLRRGWTRQNDATLGRVSVMWRRVIDEALGWWLHYLLCPRCRATSVRRLRPSFSRMLCT